MSFCNREEVVTNLEQLSFETASPPRPHNLGNEFGTRWNGSTRVQKIEIRRGLFFSAPGTLLGRFSAPNGGFPGHFPGRGLFFLQGRFCGRALRPGGLARRPPRAPGSALGSLFWRRLSLDFCRCWCCSLFFQLLSPAVRVANGDHRRQDVIPCFRFHHHRIRKHAAIPANMAEVPGQFSVRAMKPIAGMMGNP